MAGAFSYTGKYIAQKLLSLGERVRTLTSRPESESPIAKRRSFVKSFVREIAVIGNDVVLTYTIPLSKAGMTDERLGVPHIVHYGGRYWT